MEAIKNFAAGIKAAKTVGGATILLSNPGRYRILLPGCVRPKKRVMAVGIDVDAAGSTCAC